MPKRSFDLNKLKDELRESYRNLHRASGLHPTAISDWLRNSLNDCNHVLTGKPGRKVDYCAGFGNELAIADGVLKLIMMVAYDYAPRSRGATPNFSLISKWLGDVELIEDESTIKSRVNLYIKVNIENWRNVGDGLILHNFSVIQHIDDESDRISKLRTTDLKLLLQHHRPNLTFEALQVAADLGFTDNDGAALLQWLETFDNISTIKPDNPLDQFGASLIPD